MPKKKKQPAMGIFKNVLYVPKERGKGTRKKSMLIYSRRFPAKYAKTAQQEWIRKIGDFCGTLLKNAEGLRANPEDLKKKSLDQIKADLNDLSRKRRLFMAACTKKVVGKTLTKEEKDIADEYKIKVPKDMEEKLAKPAKASDVVKRLKQLEKSKQKAGTLTQTEETTTTITEEKTKTPPEKKPKD